jgi:hypothetical protein
LAARAVEVVGIRLALWGVPGSFCSVQLLVGPSLLPRTRLLLDRLLVLMCRLSLLLLQPWIWIIIGRFALLPPENPALLQVVSARAAQGVESPGVSRRRCCHGAVLAAIRCGWRAGKRGLQRLLCHLSLRCPRRLRLAHILLPGCAGTDFAQFLLRLAMAQRQVLHGLKQLDVCHIIAIPPTCMEAQSLP